MLKPILCDIPANEYCEIISDAVGLTECVLVGDEYVDITNPRASLGFVTHRQVTWAAKQPIWPVKAQADHKAQIRISAEGLGFRVFESDLEVMAALTQIRVAGLCPSLV